MSHVHVYIHTKDAEIAHDPKTGQFTAGNGAKGFAEHHKSYEKHSQIHPIDLENQHSSTVAEFSKAYNAGPEGTHEHNKAINQIKRRLENEGKHSFGAIEDISKIMKARLKANYGTPQASAKEIRTNQAVKYLSKGNTVGRLR